MVQRHGVDEWWSCFCRVRAGEREAGLPSETADVEGESDLEGKYTHVYSSALTWEAQVSGGHRRRVDGGGGGTLAP